MVCVVGSNQPFEIEYCTLSKETHPTIVVIVFADSSLWAPKVCKNQAWVLKNLEYKLDRKYQLHHGTISCWLVAPMPRLFPMPFFFCEKIFLFGNSEMVIKCAFLHPQSWNLVQMKANKIIFILAFFQCHTTHGSKVMTIWLDHLISCRNEIFWIDNSHHWNLGSTSQFRIFRICRNEWMKPSLRF